jgi:hypothetical protein
MARHPRQRLARVPTVAPPQPQTLTTAHEVPRRRTGFPPRYTLALGARIGDDLTVIGHLSAGHLAELYQVWSTAYLCALHQRSPAERGISRSSLESRAYAVKNKRRCRVIWILGFATNRLTIVDFRDVGILDV